MTSVQSKGTSRAFCWHLVIAILLLGDSAVAIQPLVGVRRVVVVVGGTVIPITVKGLRDGLKDLGYNEDKNLYLQIVRIEDFGKLRAAVWVHDRHKPDVFVTSGEAETTIVKETTDIIPIIFLGAAEPIEAGFAMSLAKPGMNLTGVAFYRGPGDHGKKLEILKDAVPALQHVIILYDPRRENVTGASTLAVVKKVAAHLALPVTEKPVYSTTEAEQVISSLRKRMMPGILPICRNIFWNIKTIASVAKLKGLPLSGCSSRQVIEEGALIAYSPDVYRIGYRGAWYVDRILKGSKPKDLPVETPTKFELAINLNTAKAIGVQIPPEVLQRADKVIK